MKLLLLSEATMDDIQRRIPILLSKYFKGVPEEEALDLLRQMAEIDPTRGKYVEWLARQHKAGRIRLPEDSDNLRDGLTKFEKVKSRLVQKDIQQYTPGELYRVIEPFFASKRQEKLLGRKGKLVLPPGSKLVLDKPPYQVVKITDPKASSILCSGTKWCTANERTAEKYLADGPLYLVYKNGKRWVLAHYLSDQFMDVYDEKVDPETKFMIVNLLEPVTGIGKKNDPKLAYYYARHIIKGRWKEGEEAIRRDPRWAYLYARDVIGERWPEGEETMKKDSYWVYLYARNIIKGRWPEAEEVIKKKVYWTYAYAADVIKGRWPEGEKVIKKDPACAYYYAKDVVKGRWKEGEKVIKDSSWAYHYALHVIKGRWPEGEEAIKKDPKWWKEYQEFLSQK